jgi:hypothetical protein
MKPKIHPIHTLDARGNSFLEVIRDHYGVKPHAMLAEIQRMRSDLVEALATKRVSYDQLRTALVPDRQKVEVALVFDTSKISEGWYGNAIFKRFLPLMDKRSNHSVLFGDYIGDESQKEVLYNIFCDHVTPVREINYQHHSQFCIIYVNNLSQSACDSMIQSLCSYDAFCGFSITTFDSQFKTMLSLMLVHLFLKNGKYIIQGHEDDVSNDQNCNMCGYAFEENGYTCLSVQSYLFGVFLSYKIESAVYSGFEADREMSLNAVSASVLNLDDFDIEIESAKMEYLRKHKSGSLENAGLSDFSKNEFENLIKRKIRSNYIYNMSYIEEHDVTKFNIIIEISKNDQSRFRILGAFEYMPKEQKLRLITLY